MTQAQLALVGVLLALLLASRRVCATTANDPQLHSHVTHTKTTAVCLEIASSVSSASGVFFNGAEPYPQDIGHFAISSTQEATCSFEPGTAEDVGIALQILGKTRCPFAVKGGGHTLNPGFSSTPGVQIAMYRFANVTYDPATQTAKIGAGLIWDEVYAALEPYGVNVAGGRVSGIGVAGFTLGGGYSWHVNQYGLTIDTVDAFELVLPNGTVASITASEEDLFFALKGGFNNFGIVTHFTLRTFPQTQVWGGVIKYNVSQFDQLTKATADFAANNTDPKANIITSYGLFRQGNVIVQRIASPHMDGASDVDVSHQAFNVALLFYDGPTPPARMFDGFMTNTADTMVFTRSFLSLVQSSNANVTWGFRGSFNTISVLDYPIDFLQFMLNEAVYWGNTLPLEMGYVTFNAEPFLPNLYNHSTSPSAWPASRALPFWPLSIEFAWSGNGTTDDVMIEGIKESAVRLHAKSGLNEHLPLYGNYALRGTPLEAIYGRNAEKLTRIRRQVDPGDVMRLAGGFKF